MNLTPLEAHLFAWFLTHGAAEVGFVGRWFPRSEYAAIIGDKIGISARQFGPAVVAAKGGVAEKFVALLEHRGALVMKTDKFGGTMGQFQNDVYPALLAELTAADPVLGAAAAGGETFWTDAFGKLA